MTDLYSLFLQRRNLTESKINQLKQPTHELLQNIDELGDILKSIHDNGKQITIIPDFDCDGISSAIVGFSGLKQLGFNVNIYTSHPERGYGINKIDIDEILHMYPNTQYLLTCDVGITCYDAFEYAYQKNLKVLLTDHHEEKRNKPKPLFCEVIVNPTQLSETYSLPDICGAHVLWQVLMRYSQRFDKDNFNAIKALNVFAGIGTVGDMMRVIHQNKTLITSAVSLMRRLYNKPINSSDTLHPIYQNAFNGLREFLLFLHEQNKLANENAIDEKFLGWTLVPMLNSVKRMEMSMNVIYRLFFSSDSQTRKKAIVSLFNANEVRKKLVATDFENIVNQDNPFAPYIYFTDAPGGILGLLANKIMSQTDLPTFVVNKHTLSGSGRSVPDFPVIDRLDGSEFSVDGHQLAFGIRFKDYAQIERFYKYLTKAITLEPSAHVRTPNADLTLSSQAAFDGKLNAHDLLNFYQQIQHLRPFGVGFKEPIVNVILDKADFTVLKNKHLKLNLNGVDMLSWNSAHNLNDLENADQIIFNGTLSLNTFRNQNNIQLIGEFVESE